ncbi:MAG: MerR family transcriptional regulator [Hyphomicrobiaceae bacterium]|nr:MerR family transcriptional regulator [Hyphomicrobiaceae bacterium]MCC0024494.1 MerR family transcriptional regulator [Hyphomicrobiaceae bacterium]
MLKSPEAFRTISEAATELDLPQHVLRFWETRFSQIKPLKRGGGRRYYRPDDINLLKGIRHLLYQKGFTIKGVQKILKEQGARAVIEMAGITEDGGEVAIVAQAPGTLPELKGVHLHATAKDALSDVLRELLDCKRLLDEARNN